MVVMSAIIATASILIRGGQGAGVFLIALCTGAVLVAAGFDAATGRIPNPITYTAILLGLSVNSLGMVLRRVAPGVAAHWLGVAGPTQALLGLLVFGGIGMVCLLLAGMGGGDMKLLAAVGAMLGLSRAADALACGVAVAVVYAVINLVLSGRLKCTGASRCSPDAEPRLPSRQDLDRRTCPPDDSAGGSDSPRAYFERPSAGGCRGGVGTGGELNRDFETDMRLRTRVIFIPRIAFMAIHDDSGAAAVSFILAFPIFLTIVGIVVQWR